MNLLRFLKSTKGAIKVSNALLLSVAAGAGLYFVASTASNRQMEVQRQLRSLSSLEQSSASASMRRGGRTGSAIRVTDGGRLATAEERAAMGGSDPLGTYYKNQELLGRVDSHLGRAADIGGADMNLGDGNQDIDMAQVRLAVGHSNASAVSAAAVAQASQTGASNPTAAGSSASGSGAFTPVSMARASGGSFSGTSGPVSGSSTGGVAGGISGSEGPSRLSGSMPGGNNIMTKMGLERASRTGTSSFGEDRRATMGRARSARRGQDELTDVRNLTESAKRAASENRASSNEAGRAFLSSARSSGGISVEGGTGVGYSTSSDLATPTAQKLKAIGNHLKKVEDEHEERKRANRNLIIQLLATVLGSLGAMFGAAKLLAGLDATITTLKAELKILEPLLKAAEASPLPWMQAIANGLRPTVQTKKGLLRAAQHKRMFITMALNTAVGVASGLLIWKAKQFISNYGSNGGTAVAIASLVVAPILVGGAAFVSFKPTLVNSWIKANWAKARNEMVRWGLVQAGNAAKGAIIK